MCRMCRTALHVAFRSLCLAFRSLRSTRYALRVHKRQSNRGRLPNRDRCSLANRLSGHVCGMCWIQREADECWPQKLGSARAADAGLALEARNVGKQRRQPGLRGGASAAVLIAWLRVQEHVQWTSMYAGYVNKRKALLQTWHLHRREFILTAKDILLVGNDFDTFTQVSL